MSETESVDVDSRVTEVVAGDADDVVDVDVDDDVEVVGGDVVVEVRG